MILIQSKFIFLKPEKISTMTCRSFFQFLGCCSSNDQVGNIEETFAIDKYKSAIESPVRTKITVGTAGDKSSKIHVKSKTATNNKTGIKQLELSMTSRRTSRKLLKT